MRHSARESMYAATFATKSALRRVASAVIRSSASLRGLEGSPLRSLKCFAGRSLASSIQCPHSTMDDERCCRGEDHRSENSPNARGAAQDQRVEREPPDQYRQRSEPNDDRSCCARSRNQDEEVDDPEAGCDYGSPENCHQSAQHQPERRVHDHDGRQQGIDDNADRNNGRNVSTSRSSRVFCSPEPQYLTVPTMW